MYVCVCVWGGGGVSDVVNGLLLLQQMKCSSCSPSQSLVALFSQILTTLSTRTTLISSFYSIHEKLKVHYAALAIPMMICMTVGITLIEYFIPWTADLELQVRNRYKIA